VSSDTNAGHQNALLNVTKAVNANVRAEHAARDLAP
jgi:hypothetical protein